MPHLRYRHLPLSEFFILVCLYHGVLLSFSLYLSSPPLSLSLSIPLMPLPFLPTFSPFFSLSLALSLHSPSSFGLVSLTQRYCWSLRCVSFVPSASVFVLLISLLLPLPSPSRCGCHFAFVLVVTVSVSPPILAV